MRTVRVMTNEGATEVPLFFKRGGLGVTEMTARQEWHGAVWTVTHLATGHRLGGTFERPHDARGAVREILARFPGVPWREKKLVEAFSDRQRSRLGSALKLVFEKHVFFEDVPF